MRLTTMTDYALRVLMHAARHPDRLCTISEIAREHAVSEAHLMKVTHRLAQLGWIETVRGKGGGLRLARPPEQIVIGAVVRGIEPDFGLVECFSTGSQCTLTGHCGLAGMLEGALQSFLAHLDGRTLADALVPAVPAAQRQRPVAIHHAMPT